MTKKSLNQLAGDQKLHYSFLSQFTNGKHLAREKLASILINNVKQNIRQSVKISPESRYGEVLELADRHDLGLPNSKLNVKQLFEQFLQSRRQGITTNTLKYYRQCLIPFITRYTLTPDSINSFLSNLKCNAGGKLSYFRAIRAFCNWLVRYEYIEKNPIHKVDRPKPPKPILPSLTLEQVSYLIHVVDNIETRQSSPSPPILV